MHWQEPPSIGEMPRWLKRATIVCAIMSGALFALVARGDGPLFAAEPPAVVQPGFARTDGRLIFAETARPTATFPDGERYPVASLIDVPQRLSYGDFLWNEANVPPGRVWVRIDLAKQILSVFRGAHEIGTSVILYGADGMPTPTGVFPVRARLRDHVSGTYDAPMPYTLQLTDDGIAIHGSNVRARAATHGCIGLPKEFAAKLFNAIRVGDQVVIEMNEKSSFDRQQLS